MIDKNNAITKLVAKFNQSIAVKLIVNIPWSKSDCATIAEDKHKKNETGMPHIMLYTSVANLNLLVIKQHIILPLFYKSIGYLVDLSADANAQVKLYPPHGPSISSNSPIIKTFFSRLDIKLLSTSFTFTPPTETCEKSKP